MGDGCNKEYYFTCVSHYSRKPQPPRYPHWLYLQKRERSLATRRGAAGPAADPLCCLILFLSAGRRIPAGTLRVLCLAPC